MVAADQRPERTADQPGLVAGGDDKAVVADDRHEPWPLNTEGIDLLGELLHEGEIEVGTGDAG